MPMAGSRVTRVIDWVAERPSAGAEEDQPAVLIRDFNCPEQEVPRRRRLIDLNTWLARCDAAIPELFHPDVSLLASDFRERIANKSRGPDLAPDSDIDEYRRFESAAVLDCVDCLHELSGRSTPAVVSP